MRLRSLNALAFGAFHERRFSLPREVVLVYGPNEAGKSTFLAAVDTLLFGFEPASREAHPLARPHGRGSEDARNLTLSGTVETRSGEHLAIERSLKTKATSRFARGGEAPTGRRGENVALPGLEQLSRSVFRAVHAVSSADLIAFDTSVRRHVDQLLLGEQGTRGLRPVFKVREELSLEQRRLWRSDQRSHPLTRKLERDISTARTTLNRVLADEEELRRTAAQDARLVAELEELRRERARLDDEAQVHALAREIRALDARRGELAVRALREPGALERLEAHAPADPRRLAKRIQRMALATREPQHSLRREPLETRPEDARLLALAGAIDTARSERGRHASEGAALIKAAEERREHDAQQRRRALHFVLASALALGLGLAAATAALGPVARTALGAMAGLCIAVGAFFRKHDEPDALRASGQLREAHQAREAAWRVLATKVGVETEGAALAWPEAMGRALDDARARHALVEQDLRERELAQARLEAAEVELKRAREDLDACTHQLRELVPDEGRPERAYERLQAALREAHYLAERELELSQQRPFEAALLQARVDDSDSGGVGDDPSARLAERAAWLDARAAELEGQRGELRARIAGHPASAGAQAQERLDALEQELVACKRRRDQLALLERLLSVADHEWRDEHQPDVLRRAGQYLARVTAGRWTHLDYPEGDDGALYVSGGAADEPLVVAPPLSRGTRDQVFLCLRLGLLDHLDEDAERLPLVLDEALVHWDAARRREFLQLLATVAERRQVILLTCHDAMASEIEAVLATTRIDLGSSHNPQPREPIT